ncbi:MAG: gliding motility-associated C-terminal domain-containing protein [Bacteroidia bacterium]
MGWVQLKTDYTATGDECNYFTFGCFKEYYETNVQVVYPNAIASVYYFYDAFSIRLKQSPPDTLKARYEPPIIPNVITPNGDGLNDVLLIKNLPSGSKLQVFNRWGQLVYSQPNYDNSWAAEGMPDGTYYVEVQFEALPPKRQALQIIRQ